MLIQIPVLILTQSHPIQRLNPDAIWTRVTSFIPSECVTLFPTEKFSLEDFFGMGSSLFFFEMESAGDSDFRRGFSAAGELATGTSKRLDPNSNSNFTSHPNRNIG